MVNDAAFGSAEVRYLRGELSFEDALGEVTGADIGRDDLVQILHRLVSARSSTGPALSEQDAQLLSSAGFVSDPTAITLAWVGRDIRMQNLVHDSLSVPDAAQRLGVTTARIRQRLTHGTLWAFTSGRHRLLPQAQFTASGTVPHLDQILQLLPKDLHPLTVQALLTEPQSSLVVEGRPVSIVAWLTGSDRTSTEIAQAANVIAAASWESA